VPLVLVLCFCLPCSDQESKRGGAKPGADKDGKANVDTRVAAVVTEYRHNSTPMSLSVDSF